jgi:hypothetical protein
MTVLQPLQPLNMSQSLWKKNHGHAQVQTARAVHRNAALMLTTNLLMWVFRFRPYLSPSLLSSISRRSCSARQSSGESDGTLHMSTL